MGVTGPPLYPRPLFSRALRSWQALGNLCFAKTLFGSFDDRPRRLEPSQDVSLKPQPLQRF